MECKYCCNEAQLVFKAHAPVVKPIAPWPRPQGQVSVTAPDVEKFNMAADRCHDYNIFLCDNCAVLLPSIERAERYVPIKTVPVVENELLPEHPGWIHAYTKNNEHILFDQRFVIYWIS